MIRGFVCIFFTYFISLAVAGEPPLQHATQYHNQQQINVPDYWISEKLDGVRGYWDGKVLRTRQGKLINAPDWFTKSLGSRPLDGELWVGRDQFEKVNSIIRSENNAQEWNQVNYMIFDLPSEKGTFDERVALMKHYIPSLEVSWVKMIPQEKVNNEEALFLKLNEIFEGGGEGLILHKGDAYYLPTSVDHLLKLKMDEFGEGELIGYKPGKGKYKGQIGAFIVKLSDGRTLSIGSGINDDLRMNPPVLGEKIIFKYNGVTRKQIPRFARFIEIRSDDSIEKLLE